jgi:hypothetical protein
MAAPLPARLMQPPRVWKREDGPGDRGGQEDECPVDRSLLSLSPPKEGYYVLTGSAPQRIRRDCQERVDGHSAVGKGQFVNQGDSSRITTPSRFNWPAQGQPQRRAAWCGSQRSEQAVDQKGLIPGRTLILPPLLSSNMTGPSSTRH